MKLTSQSKDIQLYPLLNRRFLKVKEDSLVNIVFEIIRLSGIESKDFKWGKPHIHGGRPYYKPMQLMWLILYGSFKNIYSSRKVSLLCKDDIGAICIMDGLRPSHNTICRFFRSNQQAFNKVYERFVITLVLIGMIDLSTVAIDGTKIKGVNSKSRNFTRAKLDYLKKKCENLIKELNDKLLKEPDEEKKKRISLRIEKQEENLAKYNELWDEMISTGKSQISLTDPESKLMPTRSASVVGYNQQHVMDRNHFNILTYVTDNPCDVGNLKVAAERLNKLFGRQPLKLILGDKGYVSPSDITESIMQGYLPQLYLYGNKKKMNFLVPVGNSAEDSIKACLGRGDVPEEMEKYVKLVGKCTEHERKLIMGTDSLRVFNLDSQGKKDFASKYKCFVRDLKPDYVYCPSGDTLFHKSHKYETGEDIYSNRQACSSCKLKDKCKRKEVTFSKDTILKRSAMSDEILLNDSSKDRWENGASTEYYKYELTMFYENTKKRQGQIESGFGTLKTDNGRVAYTRKGLDNVNAEAKLWSFGYNVRRLIQVAHGQMAALRLLRGQKVNPAYVEPSFFD